MHIYIKKHCLYGLAIWFQNGQINQWICKKLKKKALNKTNKNPLKRKLSKTKIWNTNMISDLFRIIISRLILEI